MTYLRNIYAQAVVGGAQVQIVATRSIRIDFIPSQVLIVRSIYYAMQRKSKNMSAQAPFVRRAPRNSGRTGRRRGCGGTKVCGGGAGKLVVVTAR